jgi:C-terminal processing protease CtpA/Prc
MKSLFILYLLIPLIFYNQTSKSVKKHLKQVVKIVKKKSLYSDSLNWKKIENEIIAESKKIQTIEQCTVVTNYLISELRKVGDNHSFFLKNEKVRKIASANNDIKEPTGKYLGNNIGYVYVPGILSINHSVCVDFAYKIQNIIHSIDTLNVNGWIIDLRENRGGNMYPMIAGLGPLVGEGVLGYFIGKNESYKSAWTYYKGQVGYIKVETPYVLINKNIKIAVLIGEKTSSSGEMTTISFIGKNNTKLFGQPSGGYTTANQGFKLSDGSYLYLATSYVADRNAKKYLSKIIPDITVERDSTFDNCIEIASKWLMEK